MGVLNPGEMTGCLSEGATGDLPLPQRFPAQSILEKIFSLLVKQTALVGVVGVVPVVCGWDLGWWCSQAAGDSFVIEIRV